MAKVTINLDELSEDAQAAVRSFVNTKRVMAQERRRAVPSADILRSQAVIKLVEMGTEAARDEASERYERLKR